MNMRAVFIDRCGGLEELQLGKLARPAPGAGEVLVKVAYAGVNPADWKTAEGYLSHFFEYSFPLVIGFDFAGTIAAVGANVTDLRPGDRVIGQSDIGSGKWGSYAEYVAVQQGSVVRIPAELGLAEAAAIPTAALAARASLFDDGGLQPGQRVLIHGGAGGVGSFAIPFAKIGGAKIATTCSTPNLDYVRGLGAELAIDYRHEDISARIRAWAPEGVDLVIDAVGKGTLPQALDLLRPGGTLSSIMTLEPGDMPDIAAAESRGLQSKLSYSRTPCGEPLEWILEQIEQGELRLPPVEILPLSEVAQAHKRSRTGHTRGKLVLQVSER